MKKSHLKILLIQIIILLVFIVNTFIWNIFTSTNLNHLLFWLTIIFITINLVGIPKDKALYKTDIIQIIFIYCTLYLVITYLLGILTGFLKTPYHLTFFKIVIKIIPALIIIIIQELIRYIFINKNKIKMNYILTTIIFIISEITIKISTFPSAELMDIFELIILLIIPVIIKNILLTYLIFKSGFKPAIIFRAILETPIYFLPFFPNLGSYLESVIYIFFITVLYLKLNSFFNYSNLAHTKKANIFWLFPILGLSIMVVLISGAFKFYTVAIASNSMIPNIHKGDIVIVEKINKKEINKLSVGNVIAYEHDHRIIIHRIVEIINQNNNYTFQTKGDNNKNIDSYIVNENKIKGVVKFKIRYLGYPPVWLNEQISQSKD